MMVVTSVEMDEATLLALMRAKSYKPMNAAEIGQALQLPDAVVLQDLLRRLEAEGKVIRTRKQKYGLPEKMGLVVGKLQGHPRGFAFLLPDDSTLADVYISAENLNTAMHHDRVVVRYLTSVKEASKPEGEVIRVLERANTTLVGTLERSPHFGFVVPDEQRLAQDIFIAREDMNGIPNHAKVVVEITEWPKKGRNPEGRIVEVLGRQGDPGVDILAITRKYDLPGEFPAGVLAEAGRTKQAVEPAEIAGRRDLRAWPMVTIDGEDARDLDDAVSLEQAGDFYRLGVHIADVSHYVRAGSVLDGEAMDRGTSVYLVDRVIPMLPPELSNGICSLNAGVDRLAMSVLMEVDHGGRVLRYEIVPSVIRVDHRLTYTAVKGMLVGGDQELRHRYADVVPMLEAMAALSQVLRQRRLRRGAIDFDFPESKVKLDEQGRPVAIVKLERSVAEMLIEELMLLANETVARHVQPLELPMLYRVHEEPEDEKLAALQEFLEPFGYNLGPRGRKPQPKTFQELLLKIKGRPEEKVIQTVMLRSMRHARYAHLGLGHFGLAARYYCHFTSPIRRYPDLVVHRVIRALLDPERDTAQLERWQEEMAGVAALASEREKVAEEAERESMDLKKVEYMQRHLGDVFTGIISGVTNFGFFVELENTVEGLIHVSSLTDDYYQFLEKQMALMGEHTRRIYRLGDQVQVQVARVSPATRQIDFELVQAT